MQVTACTSFSIATSRPIAANDHARTMTASQNRGRSLDGPACPVKLMAHIHDAEIER
jgi:hypothetical protein